MAITTPGTLLAMITGSYETQVLGSNWIYEKFPAGIPKRRKNLQKSPPFHLKLSKIDNILSKNRKILSIDRGCIMPAPISIKTKGGNKMAHRARWMVLLGLLVTLNAFGQSRNSAFQEVYEIIEQKNYFKAEAFYAANKNGLSDLEQKFTEAVLDNAFNRLEASERHIDSLLKRKTDLPESLVLRLYKIKGDNALKSYRYETAGNAYSTILSDYKELLSETEINNLNNVIKLWSALKQVPPQTVDIRADTTIPMIKDMSGANTLKVYVNKDSENFLFDTGANLSTISKAVAERFDMDIIPVDINVGSATGMETQTQLAVCKKLRLGNIDVYNAVFLVVPDEALFFPEDNYRIYGLIGYPIIEAFKEVRLTQSGEFIVKKQEHSFTGNSNLAMDGLTPLIHLDGKHFCFDTGGEETTLYHRYYIENKEKIDKRYQPQKVRIGGIGSIKEFDGFIVNETFSIFGKNVILKDVDLLIDKMKNEETLYGNIGQDFIRQFETMIINLDHMFVKFE